MKRTGIKRSTKPMKRVPIRRSKKKEFSEGLDTRQYVPKKKPSRSQAKRIGLQRRSKTNSKPWINLSLRKEYAKANPKCEVMPLVLEYGLPLCSWDLPNSVEVHHIFRGGRGQKHDLLSNLVTMSARLHHMLHNGHEIEMTVLALWVKFNKGELDFSELNKAKGLVDGSGAKPVAAYLEKRKCEHAGIDSLRVALKVLFSSGSTRELPTVPWDAI